MTKIVGGNVCGLLGKVVAIRVIENVAHLYTNMDAFVATGRPGYADRDGTLHGAVLHDGPPSVEDMTATALSSLSRSETSPREHILARFVLALAERVTTVPGTGEGGKINNP